MTYLHDPAWYGLCLQNAFEESRSTSVRPEGLQVLISKLQKDTPEA
jgi:hypothetical protein